MKRRKAKTLDFKRPTSIRTKMMMKIAMTMNRSQKIPPNSWHQNTRTVVKYQTTLPRKALRPPKRSKVIRKSTSKTSNPQIESKDPTRKTDRLQSRGKILRP